MNTPPAGYPELMIDIESIGPAPNGAILAVAAVPFCLHENKCEIALPEDWFDARITLNANVLDGRVIGADTVEWWLAQHPKAQAALLKEPRYEAIGRFVQEFVEYVKDRRFERVWAKPPQYDLTMLRDMLGPAWPFHWRDDRDVRTIIQTAKMLGWKEVYEAPDTDPTDDAGSVKHEAIYDCIVQAKQVIAFHVRARRSVRPAEPPKPVRPGIHGTITVRDEDPIPFTDNGMPMMGPGELGSLAEDA